MFLKTLKLKNIRCFQEAEIDFDLSGGDNRKWTVLVGENGAGKTTVLQSIALVMAGSDSLGALLDDVGLWIRAGAEDAEIAADIETAKGANRSISLVLKRGDTVDQVIDRYRTTAEDLNKALDHTRRSYLTIGYGSSRRRSEDPALSVAQLKRYASPRARSMASLFSRDVPLYPLETWIAELASAASQNAAGIVAELVESFLPELKFSKIDAEGSIIFSTSDGEIPLQRLGDGYQSITAFVGDLLYQITNIFDDFKDPLAARGLLLIDSVGMILHPKLQRRLLAFFDECLPKMQLVIATHSLVIAQQSDAGALHYCTRRSAGVEIDCFEGEPRKLRLNQLMMTEAFGDSTYESLEVETMKRRYRELEDKTEKSLAEKREMGRIKTDIGSIPPDDLGTRLTSEQVALLSEVKQALADAKK